MDIEKEPDIIKVAGVYAPLSLRICNYGCGAVMFVFRITGFVQ